jgi:RHS repeat-associated protein
MMRSATILPPSNGSGSRYGFNGKEKDNEIEGSGNSYDFGARIYNPRLGKWLSLDPLQKKLPDLTPYNFVADNPLRFTDPDGQFLLDVHQRISNNALKGFQINFGNENYKKNPQFGFGIQGLGTIVDGGVTYPDWHLADDKKAHFDGMNFSQIIKNTERIQDMTNSKVDEFKSGKANAQKLGHDVGENLHAIQDLYSHSNFVELYATAYPYQNDISKIPTLKEALSDPAYSDFADILKANLKTGEYDSEDPKTGPNSHKGMNHDCGAGSKFTSLMPETRGKKVSWFSKAAEAVATKASKEYLKDVKQKVEKK